MLCSRHLSWLSIANNEKGMTTIPRCQNSINIVCWKLEEHAFIRFPKWNLVSCPVPSPSVEVQTNFLLSYLVIVLYYLCHQPFLSSRLALSDVCRMFSYYQWTKCQVSLIFRAGFLLLFLKKEIIEFLLLRKLPFLKHRSCYFPF